MGISDDKCTKNEAKVMTKLYVNHFRSKWSYFFFLKSALKSPKIGLKNNSLILEIEYKIISIEFFISLKLEKIIEIFDVNHFRSKW